MKKIVIIAVLALAATLLFTGVVLGIEPVVPGQAAKDKTDAKKDAAPADKAKDAKPAEQKQGDAKPADQKPAEQKPAAPQMPPARPAVRTILKKMGEFHFSLRIKPGVPEPGDMVEYTLDVVQAAKVPDPVYGDRIPVGGAQIIAKVAHEKAQDVALKYKVNAYGDNGTYGFHFTPEQQGRYWMTFSTKLPEMDPIDVKFSFPVGMWPLPSDTDMGDPIDEDPADGKKGPRRQAASIVPVGPVGPAGAEEHVVSSGKGEVLRGLMRKIEKTWLYVGKDIFAGRKPDMNAIARESENLSTLAKKATGLVPAKHSSDGAEFDKMVGDFAVVAADLASAAKGTDAAKVATGYHQATFNSCTRCHLKYRFGSAQDLARYPAVGK